MARWRLGVAVATVGVGLTLASTVFGDSRDQSPPGGPSAGITGAQGSKGDVITLDAIFRGGPIRGVVLARQRSGTRRANVVVSLHGLPAGQGAQASVSVVGSLNACSQEVGKSVWSATIDYGDGTSADSGMAVGKVRLGARLRAVRSVRVAVTGGGTADPDEACGDSVVSKKLPRLSRR